MTWANRFARTKSLKQTGSAKLITTVCCVTTVWYKIAPKLYPVKYRTCWRHGSGFRVKEAKPAAMGAVAFAAGPNMVFFLKKRAAIIPIRYKRAGYSGRIVAL